ncbi:response regulator [Spirosoma soli]|uniref:Response regulator n=1 Tax=Spirosoma soli TaxID=1770529 RepID=A0ABW5M7J6_9BACT
MAETDKRAVNNNFRQATILVVEDNQDHWTLIKAALQESLPEVSVVWVASAEEASTYLENCVANEQPLPKLMLLDLYLPEAEPAWQLLRTVKTPNSRFIRMPVVAFSYSTNREDISELYTFGGTSYITKPSDYNQWLLYFETMRSYWWETVTLPSERY